MAHGSDVEASKAARRLFGKRGIDVSGADIRVSHGICQIRGMVSLIPGVAVPGGVKETMESVVGLLRRRPDIRDVNVDVVYRGLK